MKNENWSTGTKIYATSKLPQSPATGYIKPDLKKVALSIESDDEDFIPKYNSDKNRADLIANLPEKTIQIVNGGNQVVDCGFSLDIPAGYKCCVSSEISGLFLNLLDSKRIKVNILNFGKKTILKHKQLIGKIWVEPVYFFEWITKG